MKTGMFNLMCAYISLSRYLKLPAPLRLGVRKCQKFIKANFNRAIVDALEEVRKSSL
jgi:hypothetical protein